MKKYLRIQWGFIKTNLVAAMEFRFSFAAFIFTNTLWFFLNIVGVNLIFGQVQAIGGWGRNEVLLLVTVRTLFNSLMWTAIFPNLTRFHDHIRKGQLDFVLTKPISSRYWVSSRYFDFDHLIRIVVIGFFLNYYLGVIGHHASLIDWANFILLLLSGIFIFYNACFIITTTNIWFTSLHNMENLFDSMQNIGQYPSTIFSGGLRLAMVFFIPSIFISFFPTLALLGKLNWSVIPLTMFFLVTTSVISQWFWNFALRHYTSASS